MTISAKTSSLSVLSLCAETAADLMRPNPVSIRDTATIAEAIAALTDRGFSAAPVIDEAGYPVGVVSQSDIIIHQRERIRLLTPQPDSGAEWTAPEKDTTQVRDIMTPAVFSVTPETPAAQIVTQLLALNVHRLFVVDKDSGIVIGVITTLDVLKQLQ